MIQKKIETFIKKKTNKKFKKNSNLIFNEILDSYSIIELATFIEDKLKLKCPLNKISTSNFNSIELMVKFIKKFNKST